MTRALAVLLLAANIAGCFATPREGQPPPPARHALRREVPGCYAIFDEDRKPAHVNLYGPSPQVLLVGTPDTGTRRDIILLDSTGAPSRQPPDGVFNGFAWTADSLSDTVRVSFHNGFSGAAVALRVPTDAELRIGDTLRGRAVEHWDFGNPVTDAGDAFAVRVPCGKEALALRDDPRLRLIGAGQPAPMLEFAKAFHALDSALSPAQRDTLRRTLPDSNARYHMSVGLYIRNEILRPASGEPLVLYFLSRSVSHRDDMSGALLDLYGEYLRDQPLNIDGAIRRIPPPPKEFKVIPASTDSI
jgi:hypothetical protein